MSQDNNHELNTFQVEFNLFVAPKLFFCKGCYFIVVIKIIIKFIESEF